MLSFMRTIKKIILVAAGLAAIPFLSVSLRAHCDSFDGPIIPEAQEALHTGDVQPLLKWVEPEHEAEIKAAFERVRRIADDASPDVKELAELWFLETFVRLHREGEGAAYTGLKPAGTIDPFYVQADAALEQGSVDEVAEHVGNAVAEEIRERFAKASELQKSADESTEAGREFVAAYVDYMHFIEAIHALLSGDLDHQHH